MWIIVNALYASLSLLIAYAVYHHFIAHTLLVSCLCLVVVYNGAAVYADLVASSGM